MRSSKGATAKIAADLQDGDVLDEEDLVYVKMGDRTTSFIIDKEQTPFVLMTDGYWEHPKHLTVSKADMQHLKALITAHFAAQGHAVVFDEDE